MTEIGPEINTSITKEKQAPREIKKPKEQKYFPPVLNEVFSGQSLSFQECPNTIGVSETKFEDLLTTFDAELEEDIQKWEKAARLRSKLFAKTGIEEPEEIRTRHLDYEYLQRIYDFDGKIKTSKIIKGLPYKLHPFGKKGEKSKGADKHFQKIRAFIHNHPDGSTFSSNDLSTFFIEPPSPELKAKLSGKLPEVRLLVLSNPDGYFLTFPTRETLQPTELEREIDGLRGDEKWLRTNLENSWFTIKNRFSRTQLQKFIGEKILHQGNTAVPVETNDRGDELVVLQRFLELSDKYKLPLYFMKRGENELQRISSVEDYYPDLK